MRGANSCLKKSHQQRRKKRKKRKSGKKRKLKRTKTGSYHQGQLRTKVDRQ